MAQLTYWTPQLLEKAANLQMLKLLVEEARRDFEGEDLQEFMDFLVERISERAEKT